MYTYIFILKIIPLAWTPPPMAPPIPPIAPVAAGCVCTCACCK